jgi:hypothetical protein
MMILGAVLLMLAAPVASGIRGKAAAVEAIMTLRDLGGHGWRLDIENSSPPPIVITGVRWSAPVGLQIGRVVDSDGGTCTRSGSGLMCRTRLAAPICGNCRGGDLTVVFRGTGPGRRWIKSGSGGYWARDPLHDGRAMLTSSTRPKR